MTAFASLSLQNNAAVAQTFTPNSIDREGVATWLTTSEAVFDARRRASLSVRHPKNGSSVVRIKGRVLIPIMDTIDTTKKVAEAYADVSFVIPKQANQTQRLDLRKYAAELTTNAVMTAAVDLFESVY
jgi:hypothetical protein